MDLKNTENADFDQAKALLNSLRSVMATRLIGKHDLVSGMLVGLLCEGHVLLEGVPGLAKTLAVRTFSEALGLLFKRIQFTPDLLPGDITGTLFYDAQTAQFTPRKGPVFANVILADEINRAPAKVQSALLESMEERQVTMGDRTLQLPDPFFVLATQNPIEHEGTFRLPEAQLDRFMLKLLVDYPTETEELDVVLKYGKGADSGQASPSTSSPPALSSVDLILLKRALRGVRIDPALASYAVALVRAARPPENGSGGAAPKANFPRSALQRNALLRSDEPRPQSYRELDRYIEFGPSPRASLALFRGACAFALLEGRNYVLPDDIKASAPAVLRHRIVPSYEAEADRVNSDSIVRALLAAVPVP